MVHSTALLATFAALASSALGAISVTNPSPSAYWVQFTSNTIQWTFAQGDPSTVTLQITNSNSSTLNGNFPIAEYVDTSIQSFVVTNVTLTEGTDYQVQMVNSTNNTIVYATSGAFSVRPNGTAPAPTSGTPSNSASGSSASATGSGRSGASGSASGSAPSSSASAGANSGAGVVTVNKAASALGAVLALGGGLLL